MFISTLSLRNYRNFRAVNLSFKKGVNTIVGENGSGKTNIFQAIRLLIDDSLPRNIRLGENDFNRVLENWRGHWIIIQIIFDELDAGDEAQALAMHKIGHVDEHDPNIGSYSLVFRPKEIKRKELYEYSQREDKTQEGLLEVLESITLNDYETTYRGRGNIDFSDDGNYEKYVGDFDKIIFPNPEEEQTDIYGGKISGFSIPNEVSCTFAKALRDVEADLRSYRDNPLLNLLRGKEKDIDPAKKTDIEDKVKALNSEISTLEEVKNVSEGISSSIRESVGETYAPTIKIQSELPSEIDKLMQSLKLLVGDPDEPDYQGKIWELSLGGANLIYLSLKLLEYEKVKALDKIANFIIIEEPEAHIHTHIQKTLFQKLHHHNTQVIISTHSTHISAVSQISSVNVLSRGQKEAVVFSPSNELKKDEIVRIERYLDAVRTNLLFAKGVMLVEGDAEQILIPELIKKTLGITLDEIGISLINVGSTGFENIARIFHDKRVRKNCAILTDLDKSIHSLPADPTTDTVIQKNARNSQIAGLARKERLKNFVFKNVWVEPFYAEHTFEVDFLLDGNVYEVMKAVKKIYKKEGNREKIKLKLENADVSISGAEVLRLANKFGKGWFALMVAEKINHLTNIPTYIIDAINFVIPDINASTKVYMMRYRLQELSKLSLEDDKTDYSALLTELDDIETISDKIEFYRSKLTNDTLLGIL